MYFNKKHKKIVEERGDEYIYIGSYKSKKTTIDGKKSKSHIRVKCPYCSKEYDVRLDHFKNGGKCTNCCHSYENSFAYYIQQELKEPLNKYWDWDENELNPYYISKQSHNKIWIKCDRIDYHEDYYVSPAKFHRGDRCPCCSTHHGKVHPKDSFGALYVEKAKYWSTKNKKSPYEVTPYSCEKYKFICEKCGKEFERDLEHLNRNDLGVVCINCNSSVLEKNTSKVLDEYNIEYHREYSYPNLNGVGNKLLRFDFYLPDYNLLIECQGIQHESWQKTWTSKDKFERQLEHDRRKKEYTKQNNINLLEIWYYDINNIENILIETLQIKNN
jgi:DNA-directed RNA polymerase subunit RPC12/RpoP